MHDVRAKAFRTRQPGFIIAVENYVPATWFVERVWRIRTMPYSAPGFDPFNGIELEGMKIADTIPRL